VTGMRPGSAPPNRHVVSIAHLIFDRQVEIGKGAQQSCRQLLPRALPRRGDGTLRGAPKLCVVARRGRPSVAARKGSGKQLAARKPTRKLSQ